jgi:hypothetical protein
MVNTVSMPAAQLTPDDKDWTWVIDRRCPDCGFDGSTFTAVDAAPAIRENAAEWNRLLSDETRDLIRRRRADRWSDLEYAAHVRDVYRLYLERLRLMLEEDDPLYPNWDQDRAAIDGRYSEADPTVVAAEIVEAGHALAEAFEAVDPSDWGRPGRRSDGAVFTVSTFARYLVHDPVHHLWDVR